MAVPCFMVNGTDFAHYVLELKPTDNQLHKDKSGRDIITGDMFLQTIGKKETWEAQFDRLPSAVMSLLLTKIEQLGNSTVSITAVDAETNTRKTKRYYYSSFPKGVQRYVNGDTVYDGATWSIVEM